MFNEKYNTFIYVFIYCHCILCGGIHICLTSKRRHKSLRACIGKAIQSKTQPAVVISKDKGVTKSGFGILGFAIHGLK